MGRAPAVGPRVPRRRAWRNAAWGVLTVLAANGAAAQTAPAGAIIDEIIVTARKRTETLREVPQPVTVYGADDLARLGYTTSPEIALQTPNLLWHSILGFATPNIFLRGIGNTTFNANQASPVGLHADGVYQGSSVAYGFGLLDLERVEIMKGPQGTLFGRNTTGGVINFIARKPDPAAGTTAEASATYGRFDQADLSGAVGAALSDTAAVRLAAQTLNRDGYVVNRNPASGIDRQGKIDLWSARGQARALLGRDLDVLVNVHGGENRSDVIPGKQVGIVCRPGVAVPRLGQCTDFFGFADTTDLRESFANVPSSDRIDTWGGGATLTWSGPDGLTLVAQGQYDANDRRLANDSDAGPVSAVKTSVASDYHQFSQELRLTSAAERPVTWMVGGNYYRDDLDAFQAFTLNAFGPGALSRVFPVQEGIASALEQRTESVAGFAEGNAALDRRLIATLGARWTHDKRSAATEALIFNATGLGLAFVDRTAATGRRLFTTIPPTRLTRAWSEWSGRGVLSLAATETTLLYAGVARGFKGGDFNGGALFAPVEANISDPEFVTSYEAGLKATLAGGRVSVDASAFYYDFTDQQVSVLVPGSAATLQTLSNAAKTRSKGLELDIAAAPSERVLLQLRSGLLDAEFVRFQQDPGNPATNYAGNRTASSPKLSLAGIARYTVPLASGEMAAQVDASYTGAHFFTADNAPALRQKGYWLANLRLSFIAPDDRYSVSAWIKNVANKKYLVSGLGNTAFGFLEIFPGLPRTAGVTVAGKF
jgi:iron complex outermembrane receptor protein